METTTALLFTGGLGALILGAELLVSPITPRRIVEAIARACVRPSGSDTLPGGPA